MSLIIEKGQRLRANIIKQLYYKKALSLADLSTLTKKSLPLVTSVVNSLVKEGYVLEQGLAPSTGGRRALIYLLNPGHHKYIVSVAMDQVITRLVIFDLANKALHPIKSIDLDIINDADAVDKLVGFIEDCLSTSGIARGNLLGVGIGMPGFVNVIEGINYSYLKPTNEETLRSYLTNKLNLPVFIDNDSSLIALAELNFGSAINHEDVMVVNIGWGTGLGMIIKGKLYRGSTGYAGEFSHIPLANSDSLCSCGKRGCLEVETSLLVMVKNAEKLIDNGGVSSLQTLFKNKDINPADHFLKAAKDQDPLALSVLTDAALKIGKGIATLIHIMNPELIVLSGRAAILGDLLLPPIQQAINEFCIPRIASQTKIVVSQLAEDAELLASASLVLESSLAL